MHNRFWVSFSKAGITAIAMGVFLTGTTNVGDAFGQTDISTQGPKKVVEPVFRVPKVAGNLENGGAIATVQGPNMDRVADTRNLPRVLAKNNIPTELPSAATKTPVIPVKSLPAATTRAPHPLDRAVSAAQESLNKMQEEVFDYTAIMAKREQIDGVVGTPTYMNVKVRCPREHENGAVSPFSIYMKFLKPNDKAGREVIWSSADNDGKLVVHEGSGLLRLKTFYLDPTGRLAMNGQRYPIYEAGLENLIVKLIEKAERDRDAGPCKVTYREGANVDKRSCSLIELVHEDQRAPYEFYKAQVFIDDELNLPVRYAAYDWPTTPGGKPKLIEEYTYYNIKVNVGLTDKDFNPQNPAYRFPNR